jgi:uncharacterized OB-fold protein
MAITKFIPEVKKIIDYRNAGGGFYEATCDSCGTVFYPKRANAKFCNDKCAQNSFREKIASGAVSKKKKSKPVEKKETVKKPTNEGNIIIGRENVKYAIAGLDIPTHGIGRLLKELQVGDDMGWKGVQIKRISANKYEVG